MPVVPRIEIPPRMPRRMFHVKRAISSPSSTETVISTSPVPPCSAATRATWSRIISRGTGLIAGSPTASGSPGSVTVPTPGPARNTTPEPHGQQPYGGPHQGAVGDVRIVAGVLDHACRGLPAA